MNSRRHTSSGRTPHGVLHASARAVAWIRDSIVRELPKVRGDRRSADLIRDAMLAEVVHNEGLVTLDALSRAHRTGTVRRGIAAMERTTELSEVVPDVWVHRASGPHALIGGELDGKAAWLALDPSRSAWLRCDEQKNLLTPIPVIGGGAANTHWGFPEIPSAPIVYVPAPIGRDRIGDVRVVVREVPSYDIQWDGVYPYVRPEAALADAYEQWGDPEWIGDALSELMFRQH